MRCLAAVFRPSVGISFDIAMPTLTIAPTDLREAPANLSFLNGTGLFPA